MPTHLDNEQSIVAAAQAGDSDAFITLLNLYGYRTNIWVANRGSGTVTKLRASVGANQGTFSTGGSTPNHDGL